MAQSKSKRRSRKRHSPGTRPRPAPAATPRRERPAASDRRAAARVSAADRANLLKAYGEPPPNRFGGVPASEIAIFAGAIGFVYGFLGAHPVVLIVGIAVCGLGVLEFTTREHFSGYRPHTAMLAAFPAVIIEAALVLVIRPRHPIVVLPVVIPVYFVAFRLLRRAFLAARQLRLARPPAP